ncbi:MAG: hypothetical protein ACE3L7_06870 [Candidatus Pristimantibacillus sp.]
MSKAKPDWYANAKGSFKGNFTSEMQNNVIQRIQKGEDGRMNTYWKMTMITAISISAVTAFLFLFDESTISLQDSSRSGMSPLQNNEVIATDDSKEEKSLAYTNDPVNIAFSNVPLWEENEFQFTRVNKSMIDPLKVLDLRGAGSFITYSKSNEEETTLFQGIELEGNSRPGELFELGYGSMDNVEWGKSSAFGEDLYRLSGQCGPKLVCQFLLNVEDNEVKAKYMLHSESYEADLDGDGIEELIATTGYIFDYKIYIIKKRADGYKLAEVDEALGAASGDVVTYEPNQKLFVIHSGEVLRYYQYAQGEDKLVRVNGS